MAPFSFNSLKALFLIATAVLCVQFSVKTADAATRTWDGGGSTNNWSDCVNWSLDTCPGTADVATFDATSVKNATIDAGFTTGVTTFNMNAGYSGIITQARSFTVSGATVMSAGTFNGSTDNLTFTGGFTLSGAAFNGGNQTVQHGGAFTISSGTYTASSGTTTFTNSYTHTVGGTFAHNNGSVVFNGGATTTNVNVTETFNHLELNKNNAVLMTVSSGDTLVVNGTLKLTNGGFTAGTVEAKNTIALNAGWDGGGGTLLIDGNNVQTLSLNGGQAALASTVTLNNTNFTFNGTGTGVLNFGAMNLQAGAVNSTGYDMTFSGAFVISGGTFTGGSGTITHTGSFTYSSGTYTPTSLTTVFGAGFTHTAGGTLDFSASNVKFTGAAASVDVAVTETFNNLEIAKNNTAALTIASGDTLVVNGTTTLTDGAFLTGTLNVKNTLAVASTWDGSSSSGTLLIDGSNTQTLAFNGGQSVVASTLTINNPNFTLVGAGAGTISFYVVNLQAGVMDLTGFSATFSSTFTQSGGSFTGGGTVSHNGTFTLSNGTYTASSGTTNFPTTWTHNGGTFNHGSGSATFNGSSSTITIIDLDTFNNVSFTVNNSNAKTISGGTMRLNGNFFCNGNSNGALAGNFEVQGDIGAQNTCTGTKTFTLTGSASQAWNAPTGLSGNIVVNKSSGSVSQNADIGNSGTFILTSGTWDTNNFAFTRTSYSFTVNGGTFNAGSSSMSYTSLVLGGGVYNASTGTTTLGGSWTHTAGGTFNHNNGSVVISGGSATMDIMTTETFYNLSLSSTNTNSRTIANNDSLIILGTLTLDGGGGSGGPTQATRPAEGTFQLYGDLNLNTGLQPTNTTFGFYGSAVQHLSESGIKSVGDMTVDKSGGSLQLSTAYDDGGTITITVRNGVFDLNGNNLTLNAASSKLIVNTGATLSLQGGETVLTNGGYPQLDTGSTVKYTGATGPYTLKNYSYKSLEIAGGAASVFSLPATLSIAQNLTLTSGILSLNGNGLTVVGAFSNNATLRFIGNESASLTMDTDSGAVEFVGNGNASADSYTITNFASTYFDLTLSSVDGATDSFNLGAALDVNGELKILSGVLDVTGSNHAVTVGSNIVSTGNFNARNGTVTLDGSNQSISGMITFNNLTKNVTSAATLTLPASTTVTVSGTLTLSGATGQLLSVRSSIPDTQANIDAQGSRSVQYLDLKDIVNSNGVSIACTTGCVNNGNNVGWNFVAAGFTVSSISGNTTEAGGTATFTVVLVTQPSADVSIAVSTSDATEGTVSPSSLTFTNLNWNTPQTVTVTGVDDFLGDGSVAYSIVLASSVSADGIYNGIDPSDVSLNNTDNDSTGITVVESGASTDVSEDGTTDTYTVNLTTEPVADVTVSFTLGSQLTVSSPSLVFTNLNWSTPQTLTVTAVNDNTVEGAHDATISHSISSSDPNYNGFVLTAVTAHITDNDTAGFTVSAISGDVSETGSTATYTVVLTSQPTADVSIGVSSNDTSEGTVSPSSLTFTNLNWSTPQTVTVTGANDFIVDGPISFSILNAAASSLDLNYNGLDPADVTVSCTDNDAAGFTVSAISGNVSETGSTATYTVVLTSEPTADVTIGVSSNDTSEGTVGPSSLTFTSLNWSTPQTVTVTGVNDDLDDGSISFNVINAAATSADVSYNGLNPADVTLACTDDDTTSVTLTQSGGNTAVSEAGISDSYTLVLTSQPTADVVVTFTGNAQVTLSSSTLTFTALNWQTPQTLTVSAVDDAVMEGPHSMNIQHSINSVDVTYNGFVLGDVNIAITDNDTAGFTVSAISGNVDETGSTATYTVVLTSQPTANVAFNVVSSDTTLGTVSPSALTFTSATWNLPQTVTITGVNNDMVDGTVSFSVINDTASSLDSNYNNLNPADVSVSRTDNDTAGITLTQSNASTAVTEGSTTDTLSVVLTSKPSADVNILFTGDAQISLSSSSLIFTSSNWNVPQTLTVTAVDDSTVETAATVSISSSVSSADLNFNGYALALVSVSVTDNDVAAPEVTPPVVVTPPVNNGGGGAGTSSHSSSSHSSNSAGGSSNSGSTTSSTTASVIDTLQEDLSQSISSHWADGYMKNTLEESFIIEVAVKQTSFLDILSNFFIQPDVHVDRTNALTFLLVQSGVDITKITANINRLPFSDVGVDRDDFATIEIASQAGLINGYPDGTFRPDHVLNRAEALKMVFNFYKDKIPSDLRGQDLLNYYGLESNPFSDVDLTQWYAPYVIGAYMHGIVTGYPDGTFNPSREVSHAEYLKMAILGKNMEDAVIPTISL